MKRSTWTTVSVLAVVALLIGGVVLLDPQSNDLRQPLQGVGGGPNDGTTIIEIIDNPDSYIGRTVSLNGEVDTIYSPDVFLLDQELAVIGDELLVVTRDTLPEGANDAIPNPLDDSDLVTVTGTVQSMLLTEVEREFDVDFDPEFEVEYEQRPVLVATEVSRQNNE